MATTPRSTGKPPSSAASPAPSPNPRHARRAYRAGYTRSAAGDTERPKWLDANDVPPHVQEAYAKGQEDAAARGVPSSPPSADPPSSKRPPRGDSGGASLAKRYRPAVNAPTEAIARRSPVPIAGDAGGFLLGLLGYALVFNFLQGGMPQVRGWLSAKLLNKPYNANANAAGDSARAATAVANARPSTNAVGGT